MSITHLIILLILFGVAALSIWLLLNVARRGGGGMRGHEPGPARRSVAAQLLELEELRERRLLTESEYANKRAEILRRL